MPVYEVGKLYRHNRTIWPQGAQFNYRGGAIELVLFFDQPTPRQVEAVKTGTAGFGLFDEQGLVVLLHRFRQDQGGVPWSDAPYQYHLVLEAQRVPPPDPSALTPETRALLHIILVNATGGEILALRAVTLSHEFTARLFRAIGRQAARPFDPWAYRLELDALYFHYPTSGHMVHACSVRCDGGE
jgi:hypothetical protein